MKERPIIFKAAMVQAILEGRKSQTRRVVKPQPPPRACAYVSDAKEMCWIHPTIKDHRLTCPYGAPGDRLWAKEAFAPSLDKNGIVYRADDESLEVKWKPSIYMPRAASRITLEITNVRVERVQDISEADAEKEGLTFQQIGKDPFQPNICRTCHEHRNRHVGTCACCFGGMGTLFDNRTYRGGFKFLWDSIHKNGWEANPWVWVLEFKKL